MCLSPHACIHRDGVHQATVPPGGGEVTGRGGCRENCRPHEPSCASVFVTPGESAVETRSSTVSKLVFMGTQDCGVSWTQSQPRGGSAWLLGTLLSPAPSLA